MRTLQHNPGYDTFWVFGKRVCSVRRNVIAFVVTLRDLGKLAYRVEYVLCELFNVVNMHAD